MLLLAAAGLALYPFGVGALAIVLIGTVLFVIVVQQRKLAERMLDLFARPPLIGRFAAIAHNLYTSAYLMLRTKPLLISIAIAAAAWFCECVAFFVILIGIGEAPGGLLLLQATFIYATASLLGAVSMLPSGLGATEGSMALLLVNIVSVAREVSVAATLIVRLCTLWFAVLLGVIALAIFGIPRSGEQERSPSRDPHIFSHSRCLMLGYMLK